MEYGCIGVSLKHSFSKDIHNRISGYNYELKNVSENELESFFKNRNFKAINVTIPYKTEVIKHIDFVSEIAQKCGAVNTVVNENGVLCGYNTDYYGLKSLIEKNGVNLKNKKIAILGSGGTSKTAFTLCSDSGAFEIYVVSRTPGNSQISYNELYKNHNDIDVIINTTPCGMFPEINSSCVDIEKFNKLTAVFDAVYNPLRSKLVTDALNKSIIAEGGLYMLVSQAVLSSSLFLKQEFQYSVTEKIFNDLLFQKENIVLIGMPGSGKTTAGKKLSTLLNKPFYDTDLIIENELNMSVFEIFKNYGENFFRKKEAETVLKLSAETGCIISTGGGVVLNKNNVDLLKENGVFVFLDRNIVDIKPTETRPLSFDELSLSAVYKSRKPIYEKCADITVSDFSSVEATVNEVKCKLYENTCNKRS